VPACRGNEVVASGDQDGAGRGDALRFQGGVLADLAYLQVERTGSIHHAAAPASEPGQYAGGEFRGKAVVAGVRGGAHAVVEHAGGRWCGKIERAGIKEPLCPREPALIERGGERRQPGGVLVQDVDAAHGVGFLGLGGAIGDASSRGRQ
jgi:hypothetical protein